MHWIIKVPAVKVQTVSNWDVGTIGYRLMLLFLMLDSPKFCQSWQSWQLQEKALLYGTILPSIVFAGFAR